MRPLRVLVVEDNFLVSMLLEDAVRDGGHELVGVATSSREALDIVAGGADVDIALIDIDLDDGRTGVDLAAALKKTHALPALYATGQGEVARRNPSTALGVLDKPFTAAEVILALSAIGAISAGERPGFLPKNLVLFAAVERRGEAPDREAGATFPP